MYVVNLKGEKEPFSLRKIERSAKRAGASPALAKEIAAKIEKIAYPGIETREIFSKVKQFLKQKNESAGFRFSLREAMRKLGPSGFPFEEYIGEIFSARGFRVELNQKIKGKYAEYEIDFVAKKKKLVYIGECKFRHRRGERVETSVALAFFAKLQDISQGGYLKRFSGCEVRPIIVTNAKFSSQAKKYAKGVGIELLGWNYPKDRGLEKMIEKEKLYPVTILPSFRGFWVDIFSGKHLMLAKSVLELDPDGLANKLRVNKDKILPLIREAEVLLKNDV